MGGKGWTKGFCQCIWKEKGKKRREQKKKKKARIKKAALEEKPTGL